MYLFFQRRPSTQVSVDLGGGMLQRGVKGKTPADGPDANFPTALERAGVEFIAGDATVGPGVRPHAMRASQPHKGVRSVQAIRLGERRNYKTKPNIAAHPRLRGFCQAKKARSAPGLLMGR